MKCAARSFVLVAVAVWSGATQCSSSCCINETVEATDFLGSSNPHDVVPHTPGTTTMNTKNDKVHDMEEEQNDEESSKNVMEQFAMERKLGLTAALTGPDFIVSDTSAVYQLSFTATDGQQLTDFRVKTGLHDPIWRMDNPPAGVQSPLTFTVSLDRGGKITFTDFKFGDGAQAGNITQGTKDTWNSTFLLWVQSATASTTDIQKLSVTPIINTAPTPKAPTPTFPTPNPPMPTLPTPKAPTPTAPTPKAPTPQAPTPKAPSPKAPSPKAPTPKAPTPKAPTPKAPTPKAPTPKAPTPKAPTPKAPTPKAPTPKAPTPKAPTPKAPTPKAPTPKAPTPKAPTPTAPTPKAPTPTAPTQKAPTPTAPFPTSSFQQLRGRRLNAGDQEH